MCLRQKVDFLLLCHVTFTGNIGSCESPWQRVQMTGMGLGLVMLDDYVVIMYYNH